MLGNNLNQIYMNTNLFNSEGILLELKEIIRICELKLSALDMS